MVSPSAVMSLEIDWDCRRQHQATTQQPTNQDNSNHNCQRRPALSCIPTSITNLHHWELCGTIGMFHVSKTITLVWSINMSAQSTPPNECEFQFRISAVCELSSSCVCFSYANICKSQNILLQQNGARRDKENRVIKAKQSRWSWVWRQFSYFQRITIFFLSEREKISVAKFLFLDSSCRRTLHYNSSKIDSYKFINVMGTGKMKRKFAYRRNQLVFEFLNNFIFLTLHIFTKKI